MCKARDKLDPQAFRDVHATVIESFEETATLWNGHRVFAVDGSTFNLPKTLQPDGFKRPSPHAATPQGLASTAYRTSCPMTWTSHRAAMNGRWPGITAAC